MDRVECVVVGAGVVGLAIARALALQGRDTIVVERERLIGSATSSRNSEVIHAGLYYPPGSLKSRFCVEGKAKLYAFCEARGVAHRRCGKLVVATAADQLPELDKIVALGRAAGVDDLEIWDATRAQAHQPALRCAAALHSSSTGIIDSHGYMLALQGEAEAHGAMTILGETLEHVEQTPTGLRLRFAGHGAPLVETRLLINAAGLHAQEVARGIEGFPAEHIPARYLAKGSYFSLSGRAPFDCLVYPVPEPGGLGVHLTLDLAGQARFGPDVEWVDAIDYSVEPSRVDRFYDAIRAYWPALPDGALTPTYSGIRPKLSGPGEGAVDFAIPGRAVHGVPGVINLFGIESPGLTSSLAIADAVALMAAQEIER